MQTTETMTAAASARAILHCPDWCELETREHAPEFDDLGRLVIWHTGPRFGFVMTSAFTRDGTLDELAGELDDASMTVEELRKVAVDAAAAADWLERRTAGLS